MVLKAFVADAKKVAAGDSSNSKEVVFEETVQTVELDALACSVHLNDRLDTQILC